MYLDGGRLVFFLVSSFFSFLCTIYRRYHNIRVELLLKGTFRYREKYQFLCGMNFGTGEIV
jgi:hypothetical protein